MPGLLWILAYLMFVRSQRIILFWLTAPMYPREQWTCCPSIVSSRNIDREQTPSAQATTRARFINLPSSLLEASSSSCHRFKDSFWLHIVKTGYFGCTKLPSVLENMKQHITRFFGKNISKKKTHGLRNFEIVIQKIYCICK